MDYVEHEFYKRDETEDMHLSHNRDLYDELFLRIARMHDEVAYRRHLNDYEGRGGKFKDYPCVSVGAEMYGVAGVGHQRNNANLQDFHPLVSQELTNRLGNLNEHSVNYPVCRNLVGHCAENYAASKVLVKIDPHGTINHPGALRDLAFTKAFRPRTWKNIDWCDNCHTMFD